MLPFPRLRLCALLLLSLVLFPGTSVAQPSTPDGFSSRWTDPLFRFGHPYYSHLFIDTIYKDSNPLIPCQSVFDVRIAARLGFGDALYFSRRFRQKTGSSPSQYRKALVLHL